MNDHDILARTLEAARQDEETVRDGAPIAKLIDGLKFRDSITHRNDRGSVTELCDPRWNWHSYPLVLSHILTIRPELVCVNFPAIPYDRARPDKRRLALDTHLIPFSFGIAQGW